MGDTVVLGIKLALDGKEVSGEIRAQNSELQKLGQVAQASNQQARSSADQYVASLKRQAEMLGMTKTQTMAYEASQMQLTAAQRQSVAASIQAIDAHERQERMLGRVRIMAGALGLALVATAKAAVAAATEAEQTELRLQAVVKATGGVAELTAKELIDMSSAMQDRLGINDEAVKSSMAVLLTFKEVGRESFGEAMEVAANLSKVMGTDLQSATLQLGKALQDPEQGLTALNRAGVSFNEGQKDTIKYLVATGNQAQAITLILKLMKEQGLDKVAESMNQGLFKATNTLKNEWDDLLETLGRTTVVKGTVEGVFGSLATYLRDMNSVINGGGWRDFLAFFSVGYSTPRIVDMRSARVDQPSAQELDDAEIGASGRKVAAARDQVESFLKGFQSDNDKLGAELKKFRALAGNAGLTSSEIAAGEAKIYAKLFKPGEGAQLILSLKDQLAAINPEATEVDKVTRQLTESGKKYTEGEKNKALAIAAEIDQRKIQKQALDNYIRTEEADQQLQQEVANVMAKREDARRQGILGAQQALDTAQDGVKLAEYELSLMNRSETERSVMLAQFRVEEDWRRKINELKRQGVLLDGDEERLRGQASDAVAAAGREARAKASQKLIEDTKTAAKKMDDDLQRGLTDSIFRGFEAGKGFAENFRDSLVNMFKTTILTPIIKWAVSPLTGAITGSLGSLGIPGLANAAGGAGSGLGLFSSASNFIGGGAGLFGSAGAYSLATGAGAEQAAMLAAQTGVFGAEGLAATAGASGAMTTLAAAAPYVAAAVAVASALGIFGGGGGGPAHFTGLDVSGTLGKSGLMSSSWLAHSANSDTNFSWATHDQGATGGINAAIQTAFSSMAQIAAQLGIDPARLNAAQIPFSFHSYDTSGPSGNPTTRGVINDFTASLGQVTDQLAQQLVPNLASFAQAGETATQTLLRLVQVQDQLRQQEASATDQLKGMVNSLPGQLGITSLQQFQNSLKVADTLAPLDRLANAKTLLNDTYTRAMRGDLSAVNAFPNSAQQLLSIGRDTYASGTQYQQLFVEVNRELQDVLSLQTAQQADLLKNIDVSIVSSAQEQTAELQKIRKAIDDMNASLQATQAELRRIAV